jgi:hypothetical protein
MSEPKFTKGPIEVVGLDVPMNDWTGSQFILRQPKNAPGGVAVIIGGLGEEEERANANLYAASPDAFDLAEEVANHLYTEQDVIRVRVKAREFIAKALGEK